MVSSNKALLHAEQDGIGRALTFDMSKHFSPVALPLGHDEAFGAKFRWKFWVDNMVLVGRLPNWISQIHRCRVRFTLVSIPWWYKLDNFESVVVLMCSPVSIPWWYKLDKTYFKLQAIPPVVSIPWWYKLDSSRTYSFASIFWFQFLDGTNWMFADRYPKTEIFVFQFLDGTNWIPTSHLVFSLLACFNSLMVQIGFSTQPLRYSWLHRFNSLMVQIG